MKTVRELVPRCLLRERMSTSSRRRHLEQSAAAVAQALRRDPHDPQAAALRQELLERFSGEPDRQPTLEQVRSAVEQ